MVDPRLAEGAIGLEDGGVGEDRGAQASVGVEVGGRDQETRGVRVDVVVMLVAYAVVGGPAAIVASEQPVVGDGLLVVADYLIVSVRQATVVGLGRARGVIHARPIRGARSSTLITRRAPRPIARLAAQAIRRASRSCK
jgi:hypothetical protein